MELLPDYLRDMQSRGITPMDHGMGQNEMEPVFATTDEQHSATHWTVRRTIDFLETRDTTRPFFCWTSFAKPHPPFDADPKYWQLYDGVDLGEPARGDWSNTPADVPDAFMHSTYSLSKAHRMSPQQLAASKRAYYACISQIDYNLGLLFARMREMGQLENTWIVFTSDHGEMMGDHHMGGKASFFEGSSHVPMLIRPPAKDWQTASAMQGATCDKLVCLADVMPTMLSLAGEEVPGDVQGLDLMQVFTGDAKRDHLACECGKLFAIVDGPWKYHYAAEGNVELLFDLSNDPRETRNLVTTGSADRVLAGFRKQMASFLGDRLPEAVDGDTLVGVGPAKTEAGMAGSLWPGFHSRDVPSDVTH
ncbi:MAG: sulfatase-like hydrolase/transferase [Planctomycetota bacterium]